MSRGADVFVIVKDTHHRRSPLVQGGLEIPVKVTVRMETSSENSLKPWKGLRSLVIIITKSRQLVYLMTVQRKCCLNIQMRAVIKRTPHNWIILTPEHFYRHTIPKHWLLNAFVTLYPLFLIVEIYSVTQF